MSLRIGKVDRDLLEKVVFTRLGARRRDIVVGPSFGEDAGVVRAGNRLIAASCDPITGAAEKVGWLAVHVNANDVAVCGAEPRWFSPIILLAEHSTREDLDVIVEEMHEACIGLGVGILTGHTEVTPGLRRTIVGGFMIGPLITERPITSGGGRPGDVIFMSKSAAVEGTAILARDFRDRLKGRVPREVLERAAGYYEMISVVGEALRLARRRLVSAMHDPTEGGVLGGLYELAEASRASFIVYEEKVPVSAETEAICRALGCDPLRLISSGVLLAAVPRARAEAVSRLGMKAIGELRRREEGNTLVRRDGTEEKISSPVQDELWRLYEDERHSR